ncbi:MAG: lipocalin family protein [Brachymonas sp.]|jgi:hypothetical protein|nr:lipocalin family protein [Brachymonas sp.]
MRVSHAIFTDAAVCRLQHSNGKRSGHPAPVVARAPQLPQAVYQYIVERAEELGFATEKLQLTPQSRGVQYPHFYSMRF